MKIDQQDKKLFQPMPKDHGDNEDSLLKVFQDFKKKKSLND